MAVKSSKRAYIIHQSHSGFAVLKHMGKGIITTNIHKYVVNVNKAINLDPQVIAINNSKHINKAINRTIYGLREHK